MKIEVERTAIDTTTEEKIFNAARTVFHKKGFAATRARDIAQEAGINVSLLNYYFRSKEKLFNIIMLKTMQSFFKSMAEVFNENKTSLENKIESIAERYINLLISEPDIPIFLLNELRNNPIELPSKFNMKQILMGSIFFKQLEEHIEENNLQIHPIQFMINLMSLVMFPFVFSPILKVLEDLNQDQFNEIMLQRKLLIPHWIKAMLKPL